MLGLIWLLLFNFIYAISFSSSIITFLVDPYILESDNIQILPCTFFIKTQQRFRTEVYCTETNLLGLSQKLRPALTKLTYFL